MNTDSWVTNFDKANDLLNMISEEVFKSPSYHKTLSGREIALTRGRISQLHALLSHLQRGLSFSHENQAPSNVSAGDMSKRSDAVKKLSRDLNKYQSRFFSAIAGKSNLHEMESQSAETDISTTHEEEMKEPSGELDYILGRVTNLKDLGFEINEEIDVQCRLIEDIESKEDEILSKSQYYTQKKLDEYLKVKGTSLTSLWTIVVVLFMLFVFVLIY